MNRQMKSHPTLRQTVLTKSIAAAAVSLISFAAQAADPLPAANSGVTVVTTNGVPVVKLATPTDAGLSHNKFLTYDVDKVG